MAPGTRRALDWLTARPVAHRGLHDMGKGIVENTQSAVQAALEGSYAIEVDLQLTADGEAMVFHDYTLERLTDGTGRVIDHTTAALKHVRFKACDDRMQTLAELLEQVAGRATLMLELKSRWKDIGPLEQRVAEVLKGYQGPASVMSFDPHSMIAMKAIAPHLVRGLVSERFEPTEEWQLMSVGQRLALRHGLQLPECDPHFLHYHVKGLPYGPTRLFRKLGRPVLTWTVRTPAEREIAAKYADQMIFEGFRP
ncbi:MAG: glycerophosphodiester phosphodiesterase [Alphaproteobacteria bacterium]|nr:glycerophosphodiester phosphodiesterase [Alphaproteobacteria bacterium]